MKTTMRHGVRRRPLLLAPASLLWAPAAFAQAPARIPRVGYLNFLSAATSGYSVDSLRQGLRDLGHVEGRTIELDIRYANGDVSAIPALAAALVASKPDVLISYASGVAVLRQLTREIPIVMSSFGDPVRAGFAESLARPGGNVTGIIFFYGPLQAKRLELLKELQPRITRVGRLAMKGAVEQSADDELRVAARTLKIDLHPVEVEGPAGLAAAFRELGEARAQGLLTSDHGVFLANGNAIADLAVQRRMALVASLDLTRKGGLLGYGVDFANLFYRSAGFVDRIVKGAKPASMPIEQATRFQLIVNAKTAKELNLVVPPTLLQRADEVIG